MSRIDHDAVRVGARFIIGGVLLGVGFLAVVWCLNAWWRGLPLSWSSIGALHTLNPTHWIIDLAPFVFGVAGAVFRRREARQASAPRSLDNRFDLIFEAPTSAPKAAPLGAVHSGLQVLVVDDNPIAAEVTCAQLEELGAHPTWVDSGAEAVRRVREQRWDLILMDRHMPHMDGAETTRQIRAQEGESSPPVVALSASALKEEVAAGRAAGMNGFLIKPVQLSQLKAVLER